MKDDLYKKRIFLSTYSDEEIVEIERLKREIQIAIYNILKTSKLKSLSKEIEAYMAPDRYDHSTCCCKKNEEK